MNLGTREFEAQADVCFEFEDQYRMGAPELSTLAALLLECNEEHLWNGNSIYPVVLQGDPLEHKTNWGVTSYWFTFEPSRLLTHSEIRSYEYFLDTFVDRLREAQIQGLHSVRWTASFKTRA